MMPEIELSGHARAMLQERGILEEWLWRTVETPDRVESGSEGNLHFIKAIPEYGGRFLRVVVNPRAKPPRVVTVFFDRRLGRQKP
jgi:hypothetical protein